jgi:hypothetical protein
MRQLPLDSCILSMLPIAAGASWADRLCSSSGFDAALLSGLAWCLTFAVIANAWVACGGHYPHAAAHRRVVYSGRNRLPARRQFVARTAEAPRKNFRSGCPAGGAMSWGRWPERLKASDWKEPFIKSAHRASTLVQFCQLG